MLLATVLFMFLLKYRPMRMDYSLYLRASQGLLRPARQSGTMPRRAVSAGGSCWPSLVSWDSGGWSTTFRWEAEGLALRLPPVKTSFLVNMTSVFMLPVTRSFSRILLKRDGTLAVRCGRLDEGSSPG